MSEVEVPLSIAGFFGPYRFLSNFYLVPVQFDNIIYPSAEHAFQAAKTTSAQWRTRIRSATTPAQAKGLGRQAPLRKHWDDLRLPTMQQILTTKFQNSALHQKLLATGTAELLELNTWGDQFWGIIQVNGQYFGQNNLGKLLMQIRTELRSTLPTSDK